MSIYRLCISLVTAVLFFSPDCQAVTVKVDNCGQTKSLSDIPMTDRYRFQTRKYNTQNYPSNDDCNWTFDLGDTCTEMRISCHFAFRIEDYGFNCAADYLLIDDGSTISKHCGTARPEFHTHASSVYFKWSSDYSVRDTGFRCFAQCTSTTPPPRSCVCGKVNRNARIVGGEKTEINEYPWQAGLVNTGATKPWCGGTLINEQWVLTAAHCTDGETQGSFQVILGDHMWSSDTETTEFRFNVISIIDNPNFNTFLDYDFSLLKLDSIVDYSNSDFDHVRPPCWPTQDVPVGADAITTGWGTTTEGGSQPQELMEVTVPIISNTACQNEYNPNTDPVTPRMVCAGDLAAGGIDSCQGDSGGPLVWQNSNSYEIHGVTSWGIGCARAGSPGVYGRVNDELKRLHYQYQGKLYVIQCSTGICPPDFG